MIVNLYYYFWKEYIVNVFLCGDFKFNVILCSLLFFVVGGFEWLINLKSYEL